MSPTDDSDLITLVRLAARDPAKKVLLRQALEGAGSNTLGGTLSTIGNALSRSQGPGGVIGAGIGAGLGLLLRNRRKKPGDLASPSSTAPYQQDEAPAQPAQPPPPVNLPQAAPPPPPPAPPAPPPIPALPMAQPAAAPPAGATRLKMGLDRYGNNIHSSDGGTTWTDDSGRAVSGPAYNSTEIGGMKKGGRVRPFARGGVLLEEIPPPAPIAPKKAVLVRKPAAVPVISTTIVITKKKKPEEDKPEKKKRGGAVKGKPAVALSAEPPAPYAKGGRVQVPRGSGCATRGKRFGGIY